MNASKKTLSRPEMASSLVPAGFVSPLRERPEGANLIEDEDGVFLTQQLWLAQQLCFEPA